MKILQRLASGLLTAALLAGLLTAVPAGAAGSGGFTDISDPVMSNAAEVLRLLDVVNGTGSGAFNPSGTLTRAEFCKMTVEIMGRGSEEPAQRGRTIFTDVSSTHWARGYVNLASSITLGGGEEKNGTRLIMGVGDGTFRPDRPITYGEAAAILMRVLGYGNGDVASGIHWYDGYVALARSSGLDEGLTLSGGSNLTRGQAAVLFYNLLFLKSKGSDAIYLSQLGGSVTDDVIILSTDAKAEDGTTGSVLTANGVYKTEHAAFSNTLNGTRARLVLDREKKLLAILPDEDSTFRSVVVMGSPQANAIPVVGGDSVSVRLTTPVYMSDGTESTYEKIWTGLRSGTGLVLCFSGSGQLEYIYQRSAGDASNDSSVMVAKNAPNGKTNPFSLIMQGSTNYQIYKNGIPADLTDLRQYDVGVWDSISGTLFVSDLRLSGLYEDAYPNSMAPTTVTLMGHTFEVLPSAVQDLSNFKVGSKITLLLTASGQVAGAVSPNVARSNIVGVARMSGSSATIELLDGITVSGSTSYDEKTAPKYNGRLVTVSSYRRGYLSLSEVPSRSVTSALELDKNVLGNRELSPGVRFFEQVGNGRMIEVERSDIGVATVPADHITYVGYDWAGRVDKVVLNDVTGDSYEYGFIRIGSVTSPSAYDDGSEVVNSTISVTSSNGSSEYIMGSVEAARGERYGGIASTYDQMNGLFLASKFVPLQTLSNLHRTQFDAETMTLTTNNLVLPISKYVQIYNETNDTWLGVKTDGDVDAALQQALAFSDNITAYYDRTPETGGKVRILILR